MGIFDVLMNQGYSLDSNVGWALASNNDKMGPAEREEIYRCEIIDCLVAEKRRKERLPFYGYED